MPANIYHINIGSLITADSIHVPCHGLLLELGKELVLVDSGIGLLDVQNPTERIGTELINLAGFQFNEEDTAVRRIEELGYQPSDVRHIILTHGDPDHAGGLADFPQATVHVAQEELANIESGNGRYRPPHFAHPPLWKTYGPSTERWFGLEARPISFESGDRVFLIPLFGHTKGHSGVAIRLEDGWLLHAGDAYYLQVELKQDDHPVSILTAQRADDNSQRLHSLEELRRVLRDHGSEIQAYCYHENYVFTSLPSHS